MKTRLRGARLFLTLVPTLLRLQWQVRALERRAARGEPVADRAARLEPRLAEAVARIDREVA